MVRLHLRAGVSPTWWGQMSFALRSDEVCLTQHGSPPSIDFTASLCRLFHLCSTHTAEEDSGFPWSDNQDPHHVSQQEICSVCNDGAAMAHVQPGICLLNLSLSQNYSWARVIPLCWASQGLCWSSQLYWGAWAMSISPSPSAGAGLLHMCLLSRLLGTPYNHGPQ